MTLTMWGRPCPLSKLRQLRSLRRKQKGAVLILTVFTLFVLFSFLAFSIDVGFLSGAKAEMRRSSDAASMAVVGKSITSSNVERPYSLQKHRRDRLPPSMLAPTLSPTGV